MTPAGAGGSVASSNEEVMENALVQEEMFDAEEHTSKVVFVCHASGAVSANSR